jgi:N-acetylglucosamine-6-phosphate deacetylase
MGPFHHRAPGVIGAALTSKLLTVAVIADLVHTHPAVLELLARSKGPEGVALVTDAVSTTTGGIPAVSEEDIRRGAVAAPFLADGTIAGSAMTMEHAVWNFGRHARVALEVALRAASSVPAKLLGLNDRGAIEPGLRADLVALRRSSEGLHVEEVWIAGFSARPR